MASFGCIIRGHLSINNESHGTVIQYRYKHMPAEDAFLHCQSLPAKRLGEFRAEFSCLIGRRGRLEAGASAARHIGAKGELRDEKYFGRRVKSGKVHLSAFVFKDTQRGCFSCEGLSSLCRVAASDTKQDDKPAAD